MAIVILPYQQKQRKMIILFVLLMFLIAVVLFFGIGPGQQWARGLFNLGPAATSTPDGSSVEVDTDFFDDPRYQALKPFADEPIEPQNIGRDNPFAPY